MQKRKLEELNLLDDFLFGSMVTYPKLGEEFVRILLCIICGKEFGRLKVIPQRTYYGSDTGTHGARLDVYLEEEPEETAECVNAFDIEPNRDSRRESVAALPKRVRFYHAVIDAQSLEPGRCICIPGERKGIPRRNCVNCCAIWRRLSRGMPAVPDSEKFSGW